MLLLLFMASLNFSSTNCHHIVFIVSNQYANIGGVNKVCHFGLLSISEYSHLNIVSIPNVTWNENFLINHMFKLYQLMRYLLWQERNAVGELLALCTRRVIMDFKMAK